MQLRGNSEGLAGLLQTQAGEENLLPEAHHPHQRTGKQAAVQMFLDARAPQRRGERVGSVSKQVTWSSTAIKNN